MTGRVPNGYAMKPDSLLLSESPPGSTSELKQSIRPMEMHVSALEFRGSPSSSMNPSGCSSCALQNGASGPARNSSSSGVLGRPSALLRLGKRPKRSITRR